MGRRTDIDWEAIERDYRISQLSLRKLCEKHNVSKSSVENRVKKGQWTRDLSVEVRAATAAKVREETIRTLRKTAEETGTETGTKSGHTAFSEIDLAANVNATIILRHQRRASKLGDLLERMTAELDEVTGRPVELEKLILAVVAESPLAAKDIAQVASIPTRMNTLKLAAEINTKLQDAERKAFNLDDSGDGNTADELCRKFHESVSD